MNVIKIAGQEIKPGESKEIDIKIARLPSHTQIDTPIFIHRALEDGPVLALMAGMHGDEINGVEIVRRILDSKLNRTIRGTVVCMPIVNVYGFLNYSREVLTARTSTGHFQETGRVPWPAGWPTTSCTKSFPTSTMASTSIPGAARTNYPQIRCVMSNEKNVELAAAFSAPFTIDAPFRPRSLRQAASKKGKNIIVYEGGESLRFDTHAIEVGLAGTLRLMKHLNMIDWAPEASEENRTVWNSTWVRARTAGLFQANIRAGNKVGKNQWLGTMTDPFGGFKEQIKSPATGYVIGLNNAPVINAGDALLHIGLDDSCKIR